MRKGCPRGQLASPKPSLGFSSAKGFNPAEHGAPIYEDLMFEINQGADNAILNPISPRYQLGERKDVSHGRKSTSPCLVSEIMKLQPEMGSMEPELEGLICGVINKEVELPLAKQIQLCNEKWDSGSDTYLSKSRSLQLQFLHKLSLPVLTGTKIIAEKNTSIGIALYDVLTGQVVNSGPEASAKVEIVVLEKDFNGYEGDSWSLEEFNSKIVREREGGKTLLTGDAYLTLKAGIGFVGDIYFRHNKCWMRRNEFRLGARTVDGALGLRVREAKTDSFTVEDRRGKLYQKNHPPSLSDAVWRLEKIGKDGTYHIRLSKENINTVKDFVTLLNTNTQRLKQEHDFTWGYSFPPVDVWHIKIVGMPTKIWDITVNHAQTCVLDKRAYLYRSSTSQPKTAVVFNVVGQFMGLLVEHEFIPATTDKLVVSAFQQWEQVVSVDDVASLMASSQQLTNAHHHPSTSTTLESSNGGCNFETSDTFDNHSIDVSSLGGASILDDFSSLGFENLDNIGGVDLESVGQDITDEYLNLDDFGDLPDVLYQSNPASMGIFDGHAILASHNLPKFDNPQLDVSSHEIMSSPCEVDFLCYSESQSIDDISNRYKQTLTFASPAASSSLCDTDSMIQAFSKCEHLQISDNHYSLQSHDATSELKGGPRNAVNGILVAGSSDVTMYKAQRRYLSKANAQRRWRMLFSVMRWFSVRRNVNRETLLEEMHRDPNASSQTNVQSAVNDILSSMNKAKRRYLPKKDKDKAKRRWRMLFSLMRWFSVKRKVARKSPFREIPKSLTPSPGDITSSIYSKGGMNSLIYGRPLIFPVCDMTQTFSEDECLQLLDNSCFVQSQNSESESPADIHSAVNDALLVHSPAVPINKTHRRHLLKRNKAQRRWRMLFSVVRWFSVRRNVARKTSTEENPLTLNGLDNVGSLQSTNYTNCSSEEPMPGQVTNSLICDMETMTQGFRDNGKLQIFDTHVSLQSQNSNPELQASASLHDTINDILLARSSSVAMNKAQRRYLSKRNKAQRRWRMLFSVVRWFSVRRNVAGMYAHDFISPELYVSAVAYPSAFSIAHTYARKSFKKTSFCLKSVFLSSSRYVGLAPPPSDPYGGSHVPPVPVPLPPPILAPSSYVSVKVVSCSKRTQATVIETPNKNYPMPSAFYAVFDGHGGSDAADYLNNNVMRILFEDADFPLTSDIDDAFLKKVEESHCKAFLLADRELPDDCSASTVCGTKALTALLLGRHLLVANGGDCCAIFCRNGDAVQISQDHRPTYLPERRRVEEFGEPVVHQILLTEDDEFLIMASNGIWDVMQNQEAVDIVCRELSQDHDPRQCAEKLVDHASDPYYDSEQYRKDGGDGTGHWVYEKTNSKFKDYWYDVDFDHAVVGIKIMQKLRVVEAKHKVWNSSDFGNIVVKMDEIKNKLHQFDMLAEGRFDPCPLSSLGLTRSGFNEEESAPFCLLGICAMIYQEAAWVHAIKFEFSLGFCFQEAMEESARAELWQEELIEEIELKVEGLRELEEAGKKAKIVKWKELEVLMIPLVDGRINQVLKETIVPMFSRIVNPVNEAVELAAEKLLARLMYNSGSGLRSSESRSLQLEFMDKLSLPVYTNRPIKGEGPTPLRVALVDGITKQVVSSGPEAFAKVEILVIEGDLDSDQWRPEEFHNMIVREKEGKKSLLTGNLYLNLEEGIGYVRDISFTHNANWMKVCELRLAAKVVDTVNGTRVREAVTEPFVVKDYRVTYNEKHYPPSLNDEIWRLKKIRRDGAFHIRLVTENVKTVKDFLTRFFINPQSLQNILGTSKTWEAIVEHARTCILGKSLHLYFPVSSETKSGVVFNVVGQAVANNLVVFALEHMEVVMSFADEASFHSHLQSLNYAYPSNSPRLENPSHYDCEPSRTHYGRDHTQPSTSSHNNEVVAFHLSNAANPANIPTTDSLGIMSSNPSFENASHLNEYGLQNIEEDFGSVIFPGNLFNPSICSTESTSQTFCENQHLQLIDIDRSFHYQFMNSEAQDDLSSIINGFWSSRAADVAKAQRKWSMLYSVLRSKRKIAALKLVSSEAVLASKRPKIYEQVSSSAFGVPKEKDMSLNHVLEDGNSEEEEGRISLRKKELEVFVIRTVDQRIHQVIEQNIVPLISRIVKQELESAVETLWARLNHHSGIGVQSSESRTLQLKFLDKLSQPVRTNQMIKGEGNTPFRVALVDVDTKHVVTEASAKVEIVVVDGDFDGEHWTVEEFNQKIVREWEGKKSLLTGNVHLNLESGVGFIREISFTHNKRWMKVCKLRLGAKVVDSFIGARIREAVTEPFVLKDYREIYSNKPTTPSLNDEIIGTAKMWEATVDHARKCVLDKRLHLYFPIDSEKKSGVVFNDVGQVADANKLVVSALEPMKEVKSFDDEICMHSYLQSLNDAYPSNSPRLESPGHYSCGASQTHYGHDHTQPSTSSHDNQAVPFHLPNDANPSNIPSTDSQGICFPFFGNASHVNEYGWPRAEDHINEGPLFSPENLHNSSIYYTKSTSLQLVEGHSFQYQSSSSEAQDDLSSFVNGLLSTPAGAPIAQRRWSRAIATVRSVGKIIATFKLVSSEAVLASKRPRIY
ncbi:hypothetical protein RHSIM_Rhsim08G0168600 [Rhododendron simsii]|uniref:protein-serine/threonine phosphatase n=1 Tax=Rhododendron simsii TaxID=118357 RepID=A0A834LHI1_RHOSS|nr:hypothetical protein RHSIM_Rhsim08G0168600 [Rhododendron simsii]